MKNQLIAVIVLVAFFAIATNGFLFPKFKDGCDPNPCKHKGQCKLDLKNKNLSTCVCSEGFHGKHCELKTGCSGKPCRKGVCTNDKINPSNYTCKCNNGFVGKNCDTADACAKNPCKSGKCSLDAKLKPVCACALGWGSKNCDKRNCTIIQFKGKNFNHKQKVFIDKLFEKKLHDLDALAKICNVRVWVKRSFSLQPDPKALADNQNAPFYIGRGLDIEVHDKDDKLLCNSVCLGKTPIPIEPAKCLVSGLNAIGLKWSILHPGLVHDGSHLANLTAYKELKEHHQIGCKDMKF